MNPSPQNISRMSIRARVAFGLVCLERAGRHCGLSEDQVRLLVQDLWWYTSAEELSRWGCDHDTASLQAVLGESVSAARLEWLAKLFHELDEIGGGNLFGAFRNQYALEPTVRLAQLLAEEKVAPPPTQPFIRISPRRFWNAWGRKFEERALKESLATLPNKT